MCEWLIEHSDILFLLKVQIVIAVIFTEILAIFLELLACSDENFL